MRVLVVAALLLWTTGLALADASVSKTQLMSWGIQPAAFRLMVESGDGKTLVAEEKELDLHVRATGLGYKMRIFHLDGNSVSLVETIPLPVSVWDQTAINDDGSRALVTGELGTKILDVDLANKTCKVLMEHQKGQAGFRNDPRVSWFDGQNWYMLGYFYDAEGVAGPDVVARVNPASSGAAVFEKLSDILPMETKTSPRYSQRIITAPDQAVFITAPRPDRLTQLKVYDNGQVLVVDAGVVYGTLAATPNRVLYSIRRGGTQVQHQETWLKDIASGQKWQIGKEDVPYLYGFISRDGKTVAISSIDLRHHHMSLFYAREADGFTLKPLPGLQNVPLGNFRLSADGTGWGWMDPTGIRMGTLP